MLTLLLSLAALADTPGFALDHTPLFSDLSGSAHTPLSHTAATVLGPAEAGAGGMRLVPVRLASGQEGFIEQGRIAVLAAEGDGVRYYLTDAYFDGERRSVTVVLTDETGALLNHASGPAASGERLHRIADAALPGVDELVVIEAWRSSCPGGGTMKVLARSGVYLTHVTTAHTAGEETWHDVVEVYRPVRDADGVLRYRHLTRDTVLEDPVIPPQPGVLIAVESTEEPWGDAMGREYTRRRTSQRVIRWSVVPR